MSNFELKKASRQQSKLRIGLSGPSGSGKTHSALLLAKGMVGNWEKIAIIDTENRSADLYSHLGDYNVLQLEPDYSPERYIEAIKTCENAGVEVIIIDSTSHEWEGKGGCLEINDKIAQTKFKGNTWSAWSVTTPRHQKFIEAITQSSCHIITTARSKTDTMQVEGKIKKVGIKEIQREGFEYELTLNFNIDREGHYATSSKDRTNLFIDRDPFVISEQTGKEISEWNIKGEKVKTPEELEAKLKEKQQENYILFFEDLQKVKTPEELEAKKVEIKNSYINKGISKENMLEIADLIKGVESSMKEIKPEEEVK